MKTTKATLGFILVLLVCFTVICGCKEEKSGNLLGSGGNDLETAHELGTFPGLDAETEKQILQDYFDTYVKPEDTSATVNDIWIGRYCGTYNGVEAVKFFDSFWSAGGLSGEVIAGLQFYYHKPIFAWENGGLYRLRDAYDSGLFTDDDVKSIHRMYYAELTDDDYADFIGGNNHD
jgi:hypothetical protein